jgi:hypothetical protein
MENSKTDGWQDIRNNGDDKINNIASPGSFLIQFFLITIKNIKKYENVLFTNMEVSISLEKYFFKEHSQNNLD